jgi:hypothetical protein
VQRGRDARRDFLDHRAIGGERAREGIVQVVAGGGEAAAPALVDEVRVEREVELDVPAPGLHGLGDQVPLQVDHMIDELVEALVAAGGASLEGERMGEDGRRREGHLERTVCDARDESGLPRGRRVDLPQTPDDAVHVEPRRLAPGVRERDRLVGRDPVDRVVEGVEKHPAAQLAVGDDVEPDLLLTPDDLTDGLVLERLERREVLGALVAEQGAVARLVHLLDRGSQPGGAEEAAHDLGPGGRPRAHGRL